jgi:hypothetical protein
VSYRLFEDKDGSSGYTQVGGDLQSVSLTYDLIVPLYLRMNARYILKACNSGGCADSNAVNVSGTLGEAVGYFKPGFAVHRDNYGMGWSLALSSDGNTLAISSRYDDANASGINQTPTDFNLDESGAVYVFSKTANGVWTQQAFIKPDAPLAGEMFGHYISLSADGSTLAVGAPGEQRLPNGSPNTFYFAVGAVYVFERSASSWNQTAYLKASNAESPDGFGNIVSLSGDGKTLLATSMNETGGASGVNGDQSDNSVGAAGAGYVFTKSGTTWSQRAYLKASNPRYGNYLGYSGALSSDGSTIVLGAPGQASHAIGINGDELDQSAIDSGAAYVYTVNGSGIWSQQAYIKPSNTAPGSYFGNAVAISADGATIAVGSQNESNLAQGINAPQSGTSASLVGAAYVFTRVGSTWSQESYLKASNAEISDRFGSALALSADGNTLVVSAPLEAGAFAGLSYSSATNNDAPISGAAYVFIRSQGTWVQRTYVKAPNAEANDYFGFSTAISGDGNSIAISAMGEKSAATGVNGNLEDNTTVGSGAAYLY